MNWARNLLFVGVVGGGLVALIVNLLPPRKPAHITHYENPVYQDPQFREVVARVDGSFQQDWQSNGISPRRSRAGLDSGAIASPWASWARSRRSKRSGSSKSCQPDQRMPWYIDHVLADERNHDYVAERLARAYRRHRSRPLHFLSSPSLCELDRRADREPTGPTTRSFATSSRPRACGPTTRPRTSSA